MPVISLATPKDFRLRRDVSSYGYFVLAPNYWDPIAHVLWRVLTLEHTGSARLPAVLVRIEQPASSKLRVTLSHALTSTQQQEVVAQVTRMLRLDESTADIARFHALDPRFKKSGRGRVFRSPTLFEDVIKTVTSCNVTWPSTIIMNRNLCAVLGPHVHLARTLPQALAQHSGTYGFPTAQSIAAVRPSTLRARCRVGYRDQRIVDLAKRFITTPAKGGIDQTRWTNPALPNDTLFNELIELPGIGPYAAANIMQLLGRYARLPLDTESIRHGRTILGFKGPPALIMKRVRAHFAPMQDQAFRSYWFEIWSAYESKLGPAWTWERDTTGRMFTAALTT